MSNKSSNQYISELQAIGLYIRELRLNLNLTQEQLTDELSIHQNTLSRIENGSNMTLLTLLQLADYLKISPSDVLSIIEA